MPSRRLKNRYAQIAAAVPNTMLATHPRSDKVFRKKPTNRAIAGMNPMGSRKKASTQMATMEDQMYE
jgi:hypothetical protein